MKKRLIGLALALAMILSLAACGNENIGVQGVQTR